MFNPEVAEKFKNLINKTGFLVVNYESICKMQKIRVVEAVIKNVTYDLAKDNFEITVSYRSPYKEVSFHVNNFDFLKTKFVQDKNDIYNLIKQNCLAGSLNNLSQSMADLDFKIEKYQNLLKEAIESKKQLEGITKEVVDLKKSLDKKGERKTKYISHKKMMELDDFIIYL